MFNVQVLQVYHYKLLGNEFLVEKASRMAWRPDGKGLKNELKNDHTHCLRMLLFFKNYTCYSFRMLLLFNESQSYNVIIWYIISSRIDFVYSFRMYLLVYGWHSVILTE